ncbi:hypothetical protein [Nonlabens xiamenensis]|uniref:hypothetical protein n=1 Tax=Nonlabens xiamenensis TaxID=2341043 RepID=UPI000F614CD4|nr:hypothetical protein [Nonlabens xiamenensis]
MKTNQQLIRSLEMIASFPEHHQVFGRPEDYIELHQAKMEQLTLQAENHQDLLLKEVLEAVPTISLVEVRVI